MAVVLGPRDISALPAPAWLCAPHASLPPGRCPGCSFKAFPLGQRPFVTQLLLPKGRAHLIDLRGRVLADGQTRSAPEAAQ